MLQDCIVLTMSAMMPGLSLGLFSTSVSRGSGKIQDAASLQG